MKRFCNILALMTFLFFVSTTSSCSKTGKKVAKEIVKSGAEKGSVTSAKALVKSTSDDVFKLMSKPNMKFNDVIDILSDAHPKLVSNIKQMDMGVQEKLIDRIKKDKNFFDALTSPKISNEIFDNFHLLTKNVPTAFSNFDVFSWISNSAIKGNKIDNIILKKNNDAISFYNKIDGTFLGEYANKTMTIYGSDDIFSNPYWIKSISKLPNTTFKYNSSSSNSIIFRTDEFGVIHNISSKNSSIEHISNCICKPNDFFNFDDWNKMALDIKKYSKGNDISVTCKYKYLDDKATPKYAELDVNVGGKRFNKTLENKEHPDFNKKTQKQSPKPKHQMTRRDVEEYVPKGNGGINKEGRTIKDICKQPVPDELLNVDFIMKNLGIKDRKLAQRISDDFRKWTSKDAPMPSKDGYVNFSSVEHPSFKVKLPNTKEELLKEVRKFRPEATLDDLNATDVRRVSYSKMRRQIAEHYGIPESKAGDLIGTMDCVIHETTEGFATIVPNNLHRCKDLYSHKGYVSKMMMEEMDEALIEKSLKKSGI